jgi:hypothetical protein
MEVFNATTVSLEIQLQEHQSNASVKQVPQ